MSFQPSYPSITSLPMWVMNLPKSRRRPLPTGAIQLTVACWRSKSWPWKRPAADETLATLPATASTLKPTSPGFSTAFWMTISAASTLTLLSR